MTNVCVGGYNILRGFQSDAYIVGEITSVTGMDAVADREDGDPGGERKRELVLTLEPLG